jgi:hypothetical protein
MWIKLERGRLELRAFCDTFATVTMLLMSNGRPSLRVGAGQMTQASVTCPNPDERAPHIRHLFVEWVGDRRSQLTRNTVGPTAGGEMGGKPQISPCPSLPTRQPANLRRDSNAPTPSQPPHHNHPAPSP